MALAGFTASFKPAPSFYSGKGLSELVPSVFPIALNARAYMLDRASNQYARRFDTRVRDTVDQSSEPGEAAINPQGLWRRSQSSWHYGAGQKYSDTADAEPYRFFTSKGINIWNKGQLTLLPETEKAYNSTNTNVHMTAASDRLYITDGQTVKYSTDLSTFTTVTGTDASDLYSITSDGYNVFYSYASGDIDQSNAGIGTNSDYITGIEAGKLAYVKGRLMVAGQGADKNKIWNITTTPGSSANNPSALYTHPNTNFNWVDFAAGQNHIFCAGYAGNKTLIYKTAVKADGTALDIPTVAADLPLGEIVTSMRGYLGYVLVGLSDGFRFCTPDDNGNLIVGPKIVTGSAVNNFIGIGQYAYFGWKNFDASSTGLGRIDVSVFISPNQPAYASDLMATAQGTITDIHEFSGKPIFSVAGQGLYKQHVSNLVASGYLETGIYRWGIPDAKFIPRYDMRTLPLAGSIQMSVKSDGGSYSSFVALTEVGETEHILAGLENKVFEHEARITLNRSSSANSTGPTLTRWMARAYAAPDRSEIFTVPLVIHDVIDASGATYYFDVNAELNALRELVSNPRVVVFQEENAVHSVIVEDVVWQPLAMVDRGFGAKLHGTAIVVMRTVK
jgi:hypothetical protein